MKTPVSDFIEKYAKSGFSRFHMPGHKGKGPVGLEKYDITEIDGADVLSEATGIIGESENNLTSLYKSGKSFFITQGSTTAICAMLALIKNDAGDKTYVLVARNVHKAFVYAAALLDFDIQWLWPEGEMNSLCSCQISKEMVEKTLESLREKGIVPAAVYLTSPDYLGQRQDIKGIVEVCHKFGTLLTVDNAHGAYLHFVEDPIHPMDLGADMCSDSAHKTLPVLTGGAYLQISKNMPEEVKKSAKSAMALFGSTSPSYLTMISLDKCNEYLAGNYRKELHEMVKRVETLKEELENLGWNVTLGEPLKMTVQMPDKLSGSEYSKHLRKFQVECEYADPDFIVFMFTANNVEEDLQRIKEAFGKNVYKYENSHKLIPAKCEKVLSIRNAIFAPHEEIPVTEAMGRICASPAVSCPPAIPIVISGEKIDENAINLFGYYSISNVDVVLEMC